MESTAHRVFDIPELASLIAEHLNKKEISHLMQTCRCIYEAMRRSFYCDLDIQYIYYSKTLWDSPLSLQALAKNIQFVRTLNCTAVFVFYYCRVNLAHNSDRNIAPASTSSALFLNDIFLPVVSHLTELVPLPPMTNLTNAHINLALKYDKDKMRFIPYNVQNLMAPIIYFGRMMRGLLNLRTLELQDVIIKNIRHARLLSSALLSLVNLQHLKLKAQCLRNPSKIILSLCYNAPSSIETLEMFDSYDSSLTAGVIPQLRSRNRYYDEVKENYLDVMKDWSLRDTPLTKLKSFRLYMNTGRIGLKVYLPFFRRCPNLELILLAGDTLCDGTDGTEIGMMCPKLNDLTFIGVRDPVERLWPFEIARTLPKNHLKAVDYSLGNHLLDLDVDFMKETLLMHSDSLCRVVLGAYLTSTALWTILRECKSLQRFKMYNSIMDLGDKSSGSWATTSLISLELNIRIMLPSSSDTEYIPCYLQTPPMAPSDEEKSIFSQLEFLYRQIGKQSKLHYLRLKRVDTPRDRLLEWDDDVLPMPGMLRLDANEPNRPGFLGLLEGLRCLSIVSESIVAETPSMLIPKKAREVDWIRKHWPSMTLHPSSKGYSLHSI